MTVKATHARHERVDHDASDPQATTRAVFRRCRKLRRYIVKRFSLGHSLIALLVAFNCLLLWLTFRVLMFDVFFAAKVSGPVSPRAKRIAPSQTNDAAGDLFHTIDATGGRAQLYRAQHWQDEALDELLFRGRRNGVFVEVGAGDGMFGSNSYYFEAALDWTGVCVEPLKSHIDQIERSRSCKAVHAAVCGQTSDSKTFVEVHGSQGRSGLAETLPQQYVQEIRSQNKLVRFDEQQVRCINLNELLSAEGISHVDLLAIDVEGAELEVLENLKLGSGGVTVLVFLIEVAPGQHASQIRSWMHANGYSDPWRIDMRHPDDIYFRNDLLPSLSKGIPIACTERCRCAIPCREDLWSKGSVACSETLWAVCRHQFHSSEAQACVQDCNEYETNPWASKKRKEFRMKV